VDSFYKIPGIFLLSSVERQQDYTDF